MARHRRRHLHGLSSLSGAKYQRRHYEDAVDLIKAGGSKPAEINRYVDLFKADNPRFNESFFRAALKGERKHRSRRSLSGLSDLGGGLAFKAVMALGVLAAGVFGWKQWKRMQGRGAGQAALPEGATVTVSSPITPKLTNAQKMAAALSPAVQAGVYSLLAPKAPAAPKQPAASTGVAAFQKNLAALGYSPGAITGVFDSATLAAMQRYQTERKLPVTTVADARTVGQAASDVKMVS